MNCIGRCVMSRSAGQRLRLPITVPPFIPEQLDRVNDQMDTIHEDIKHTEQNLDNLEKCCGLFTLPWKKYVHPDLFHLLSSIA